MTDPILNKVRRQIKAKKLSVGEAAAAIGIGTSVLTRHLAGEYVRSDSLAKYRLWLNGAAHQGELRNPPAISPHQGVTAKPKQERQHNTPIAISRLTSTAITPKDAWNVVDLFSGCGGMSLGFERFNDNRAYRIAMALDIEEPMVRVFNDNHPSPSEDLSIARQSDITDFMSEAEIQAFYLDHLARTTTDTQLTARLNELSAGGVAGLRRTLKELDQSFLDALGSLRSNSDYITSVRELGSPTLGQTSVAGFHSAVKLPTTGTSNPRLGPLIWHQDGSIPATESPDLTTDKKLVRKYRSQMSRLWDAEIEKLTARAGAAGHGQLVSSADRIKRFLSFLETASMRKVKTLWLDWRASREALRASFFGRPKVQSDLRAIYEDGHQVSVLLGGPPCQGFSRIGRGKIRSLREQGVHVHEDEDSVDSRNQLMHQYVLFVAALAPKVFLFENVRHFQAVVKSDGIEFDAADILAEAIEAVSVRGLDYAVSRRIVVASHHAVPQARERFVMAGVRKHLSDSVSGEEAAAWCLSLEHRDPVPLQVALEGLPEPTYSNQKEERPILPKTENLQPAANHTGLLASDIFRDWAFRGASVDAHIARPPRPDDGAFFALMGPGKRWMDYRCDDAPTLLRLTRALEAMCKLVETSPDLGASMDIKLDEIRSLVDTADGSLSLRLLLESIPPQPGEIQHHLLTSNYLRKREGAHGDWLSRMDPALPSKTVVSHMAKDTYAFVHPFRPRTLSVREAARVQSFPDDYRFGSVGLVDGFRVVGNAVPPLLSLQFAERVAQILALCAVELGADGADNYGEREVIPQHALS